MLRKLALTATTSKNQGKGQIGPIKRAPNRNINRKITSKMKQRLQYVQNLILLQIQNKLGNHKKIVKGAKKAISRAMGV